MKRFLLIVLLASTCAISFAQVDKPAVQTDVPQIAEWEILRRGRMVQETGTIRASQIDYIADALAPPENDAGKWWITVVTKDNDAASEKLKSDFMHSQLLRAWVNTDDAAKSNAHYQVRRYEDGTQKDWLAGVKPEIDKHGLPTIIVQPPKDGTKGDNKNVVFMLHGYNGSDADLMNKMRDGVAYYTSEMVAQGLITAGPNAARKVNATAKQEGGIKEAIAVGDRESDVKAIPTPVKAIDSFAINGPIGDNWPPSGVPTTPVITLADIMKIAPDADMLFVQQVMASNPKTLQDVQIQYLIWKQSKVNPPVNPAQPNTVAPVNPIIPSLTTVATILNLLMSGGGWTGLVVIGLTIWRKLNKNQVLNDTQFAYLLSIFKYLGGNPDTNPLPNPTAPIPVIPPVAQ